MTVTTKLVVTPKNSVGIIINLQRIFAENSKVTSPQEGIYEATTHRLGEDYILKIKKNVGNNDERQLQLHGKVARNAVIFDFDTQIIDYREGGEITGQIGELLNLLHYTALATNK